jgi:hypothetical protein
MVVASVLVALVSIDFLGHTYLSVHFQRRSLVDAVRGKNSWGAELVFFVCKISNFNDPTFLARAMHQVIFVDRCVQAGPPTKHHSCATVLPRRLLVLLSLQVLI